MPDDPIPSELPWYLAEVIEVEKAKAVQCQRRGCGRRVYRAVHLVVWADGRIECWGGKCFAERLAKHAVPQQLKPQWSSGGGGSRLTDEERAMLDTNREELIARFRQRHELWVGEQSRKAKAENARAQAIRLRLDAQIAANQTAESRWQAKHEERIQQQARLDAFMANAKKNRQPRPESRVQLNRGVSSSPAIREPNDPRYFEIKRRLEASWRNSGQSLAGSYQQRTLIQNAIVKYRRDVLGHTD